MRGPEVALRTGYNRLACVVLEASEIDCARRRGPDALHPRGGNSSVYVILVGNESALLNKQAADEEFAQHEGEIPQIANLLLSFARLRVSKKLPYLHSALANFLHDV